MLFILFGTMAKMGYESRQYLERQGFEQITKLSYAPPETAMVTRNGKRTYATLEEVLRCDFTYTHNDFTVGFNKDQIIDAVTGRKDCLLSLSANSIDFIEQLKLAYGDYVTTIFVYTNRQLLEQIVDGLEDITEAEKALRLSTGKRIRELFLEKRSVFDEVVLYDGEDSLYNLQSLYTQYDTIIRKARRTQQLLNNRNYVELPYSGPDGYIFVSYAHADESAVYPVLAMLQRNHCRVWYDRGIKGGANWRQLLAEKIKNCDKFFLFSSANSASSTEVKWEINIALTCQKDIVTVRMDDAQFDLAYEGWLRMSQNIFSTDEDFEKKLTESASDSVKELPPAK